MEASVRDQVLEAADTAAPPPSTREPGRARQRILDVARDQFGARGYAQTPLRAVSDALGVTKAALYHHFKAKDDLLSAIVHPVLDRVDELIDGAGPSLAPQQRPAFLAAYVDLLVANAGTVGLVLRDPAVGEHPVGRRFARQHARMRTLLGSSDDAPAAIRATTALRVMELAVAEFGDADTDQLRATVLGIAIAVLDSTAPGPPPG